MRDAVFMTKRVLNEIAYGLMECWRIGLLERLKIQKKENKDAHYE
jgi:hypothetical protein